MLKKEEEKQEGFCYNIIDLSNNLLMNSLDQYIFFYKNYMFKNENKNNKDYELC